MGNSDTTATISNSYHRYGAYTAELETPVAAKSMGRTIFAHSFTWEPDYAEYFAYGFYAKKDGTEGARRAATIIHRDNIPAEALAAIDALRNN